MIGLGIGVAWTFGKINRFVSNMILAFKERVYAEGGTFEASVCLEAQLEELRKDKLLSSTSLLVTPNAVEESKLFSIVPSSGDGDLNVVRATTGSFVNSSGIIEYALPNVPRLDYTNSTCPAILVEPQKTNFLTNSNAASAGTGVSYTIDAILAPNGIMEADYIQDTAANSEHYSEKQFNVAANTQYTYSIFAKGDGSGKKVYLRTALRGVFGIQVDLATGVVAVVGAIPPTAYGAIFYPTLGYWRIYMTYTSTTAGVAVFRPQIMSSGGAAVYTGNGTGYYVWGQQLETGTLSSQITTGATSVTRNADVISKTEISSLIGQTEGTIYFEYLNKNGLDTIPFRINGNDGKFIWIRGTGVMFFGNGTSLIFNNYSIPTANQLYKIGFVYGQNDFRLYVNGNLVGSSTSGTFTGFFDYIQIPALPNEDPFGQQVFIKNIALWKSKLSNTELANLTTI